MIDYFVMIHYLVEARNTEVFLAYNKMVQEKWSTRTDVLDPSGSANLDRNRLTFDAVVPVANDSDDPLLVAITTVRTATAATLEEVGALDGIELVDGGIAVEVRRDDVLDENDNLAV